MDSGYFSVPKSAVAKHDPVFTSIRLQFHVSNNAFPVLSDLFLFCLSFPFASLWEGEKIYNEEEESIFPSK